MVFSELRPFGILDSHVKSAMVLHAHRDKVFWIPLGVPFRVTGFHVRVGVVQDHLSMIFVAVSFKICPSCAVVLSLNCLCCFAFHVFVSFCFVFTYLFISDAIVSMLTKCKPAHIFQKIFNFFFATGSKNTKQPGFLPFTVIILSAILIIS